MSRVVSGARGTKEEDGVLVIAGSRPLERNTLRSREGPGLTGSLEDRRRAGPLCLRSPEALCRSLGCTVKEEGSFKGRTGWTRKGDGEESVFQKPCVLHRRHGAFSFCCLQLGLRAGGHMRLRRWASS